MIDQEPIKAETSESEPEQEVIDGKRGIFIRLSPDSKRALEDAKKMMVKVAARQRTYSGVIEKLLEYYRSQNTDVQTKILTGEVSNPLKEASDLLARLHRAQHAFETKRFYFAIKTYNAIAESLKGDNSSPELMDVCHFRLAHCWNQLSYTLRNEALSPDKRLNNLTPELYKLALGAIDVALAHLDRLQDGEDDFMAQIKNYNFACCYSLRAQYLVEATLSPEDPEMISLSEARKDIRKTAELWSLSIGKNDLDKVGEANSAAVNALDWLRKIGTTNAGTDDSPSGRNLKLKSENIWIVETAKEDPDLLFLRSSIGWKKAFEEWTRDSLNKASIVEAIDDLLKEERKRKWQ
jgi:hypothetical protein